jgi:hypothetical protein
MRAAVQDDVGSVVIRPIDRFACRRRPSCLTQSMPIDSPTVRASSAVKLARSPI